jgi:Fe-S cluster assembly protein SufD
MFSPMVFWWNSQRQVLDVFSGTSGKKIVDLDTDAAVKYVFVVQNSDVDIEFNVKWNGSRLEVFGIFVGDVKSQVLTSLLASNSFARVHLFCVVKEGSEMFVDGNIFIGKDVEGVEGHLAEEQFLLWNPKHLLVRPLLDVHSHRVKASHWAKIHTLDQQKLFYIMAKWLSLQASQTLVITSWLQAIFDSIWDVDSQSKQQIFNQIIESLFIPSKIVW